MTIYNQNEDDKSSWGTGDKSGTGGKSGSKGFRIKLETSRDDLLAPNEIRHLLEIHQDIHKAYVDKQKMTRKERAALKEGRNDLVAQYRSQQGLTGGGGSRSNYKSHPISNKVQFSGIDKQLSNLPSENIAETNAEMRNDLENKYMHRLQPQHTFNPKPRPF